MPSTDKAPDSEGIDVTLIGSFNAAIFQPQWFVNQNVIGKQEGENAKVNVISGEITDIEIGDIRLVCISERLTVSTSNIAYSEKVRDLVENVLKLLPHTPIRACGINSGAHFSIASIEYWHKIGHQLAPKDVIWNDLFDQPGMQSLSIKAVRNSEFPGEINVKVEPSMQYNPGLHIRVNWHYDPESPDESSNAPAFLRFFESEWDTAGLQARKVANKIFEKITPNN